MGQRLSQISTLLVIALVLAACSSHQEVPQCFVEGTTTIAPRRATSRPYEIRGVWYYPQPHYEYEEVGIASYYGGGDVFHGRPTATGAIFDMNGLTGAHKTLPLPCIAEITNLENGRQIQIEINDRGPFIEGRIVDVSRRTAQLLGFERKGTAQVRVRTLVPESLALNGIDPSSVMLAQASPPPPLELAPAPIAEIPVMVAELPSLPDDVFVAAEPTMALAEGSPPLPPASSAKVEALPSTGIFVHVGEYDNHAGAQALSHTLEGFTDVPANPVKSNGPKPYVVRLGPLPSMSHANQVLDQLVDAGHLMSRIVIQR